LTQHDFVLSRTWYGDDRDARNKSLLEKAARLSQMNMTLTARLSPVGIHKQDSQCTNQRQTGFGLLLWFQRHSGGMSESHEFYGAHHITPSSVERGSRTQVQVPKALGGLTNKLFSTHSWCLWLTVVRRQSQQLQVVRVIGHALEQSAIQSEDALHAVWSCEQSSNLSFWGIHVTNEDKPDLNASKAQVTLVTKDLTSFFLALQKSLDSPFWGATLHMFPNNRHFQLR